MPLFSVAIDPVSAARMDAFTTAAQALTAAIQQLLTQGVTMALDPTVQAEFAKLTADVAAQTSVIQSANTLLNGLTAQIAALKQTAASAGAPAEVIAAIGALETSVQSNSTTLAAAVTANTPAA